jgi:hypothetical protein
MFSILLIPLYLLFSNGLVLEAHYCMGKLAGTEIGLTHNTEDNCGTCGMDLEDSIDNHCCKDELKLLKLDGSQKLTTIHYNFSQSPDIVVPYHGFVYEPVCQDRKTIQLRSHAPPDPVTPALYIQHRVFRI